MPDTSSTTRYRTPSPSPGEAEAFITRSVVAAWLDGVAIRTTDIFTAWAGLGMPKAVMLKCINRWRDCGILSLRNEGGGPSSPTVLEFNPSWDSSAATDLGTLVEEFLADDTVPESVRQSVATALRTITGAAYASNEVLVARCSHIGMERLALLGKECDEAMKREQLSERSRANRVASLRTFIRFAAASGKVRLVFPASWDLYNAAAFRYFPIPEKRRLRSNMSGRRRLWRLFVKHARRHFAANPEMGPFPAEPDDLTAAQAEAVLASIRAQGEIKVYKQIGTALSHAGNRGCGPLRRTRGATGIMPWRLVRSGSVQLKDKSGKGTPTWASFTDLCREHGLPKDLTAFFDWSFLYCTLDEAQLERDSHLYPHRPGERHALPRTVDLRRDAMKVYLGVALNRCSIPPAELTIRGAFVTHYQTIKQAMISYWDERVASGIASSPYSIGLSHNFVTIGLLADLAGEYLYHQRTHKGLAEFAAGDDDDLLREDVVPRNRLELSLKRTYERAYRHARTLDQKRANTTTTRSATTKKDIHRLVGSLSIEALEALQEGAVADAARAVRRGDDSYEFHCLVADTVLSGWELSTAARGEELTHIRTDIQSPPSSLGGDRVKTLRGIDRKQGGGTHWMYLIDRFVPLWLEKVFLDRSRPYFMRGLGERKRLGHLLAGHKFYFVDRQGQPYGCIEETFEGENRHGQSWKLRVPRLTAIWQEFAAPRLFAMGIAIPTDFAEFTLHALRGRAATALIRAHGIEKAARVLGDTVVTLRRSYDGLDAHGERLLDLFGTQGGRVVGTISNDAASAPLPSAPSRKGRVRGQVADITPAAMAVVFPAKMRDPRERKALVSQLHGTGSITHAQFFELMEHINSQETNVATG